MAHLSLNTPVGILTLFETNGALSVIEWGRAPKGESSPMLEEAAAQLRAYFKGSLRTFDLPLDPQGSDFQKAVCHEMSCIAYGATTTYGAIGKALGKPAQPVGGACGRNPISIIIPCHRVLAANGAMTGYSGGDGIETKTWLLNHEGVIAA